MPTTKPKHALVTSNHSTPGVEGAPAGRRRRSGKPVCQLPVAEDGAIRD